MIQYIADRHLQAKHVRHRGLAAVRKERGCNPYESFLLTTGDSGEARHNLYSTHKVGKETMRELPVGMSTEYNGAN